MPGPAAAVIPTLVTAGASLGSAALGSSAARRAADAQVDAAKMDAELQRRNMLLQATINEPQRFIGNQATADMASLYGYAMPAYTSLADLTRIINGGVPGNALFDNAPDYALNPAPGIGGAAAGGIQSMLRRIAQQRQADAQAGQMPTSGQPPGPAGNFSRFFTSPDYEFRRSEGLRGIERSAAARGGAASGAAIREATRFASGLASGEYGNYWNRLAALQGIGQVANQNLGSAASSYAANAGNAYQNAGDARASGIMNSTNALTGSLNNGLNTWLMMRGGWFDRPTVG